MRTWTASLARLHVARFPGSSTMPASKRKPKKGAAHDAAPAKKKAKKGSGKKKAQKYAPVVISTAADLKGDLLFTHCVS